MDEPPVTTPKTITVMTPSPPKTTLSTVQTTTSSALTTKTERSSSVIRPSIIVQTGVNWTHDADGSLPTGLTGVSAVPWNRMQYIKEKRLCLTRLLRTPRSPIADSYSNLKASDKRTLLCELHSRNDCKCRGKR